MQVVNATQTITDIYPIVSKALDNVAKARIELGKGLLKTGDLITSYAIAMNEAFGLGWWDAKGEIKKTVKIEHTAYVDMCMDELGWTRSNTDKQWSEIKDKAGRPKKAGKVSGGNSIDDLNIRDLKTILNRILGADTDEAPLSHKAKELFLEAADLLGIDTETELKK
jgi:hypothetical protein